MHAVLVLKHSRPLIVLLLLAMQIAVTGCSLNVTRYTDGPLTRYLKEPIPTLDRPVARSLSLEKVTYLTSANYKGTMISDLVAREIYILPADVGREVDGLLQMDDAFSEDATIRALNTIAENRAKARSMWGGAGGPAIPPARVTDANTVRYIQRHESMAREAYNKGNGLQGNIHTSAAMNAMTIDQSFQRTMATLDFISVSAGALKAVGESLIKDDFNDTRDWLERESGAIGDAAPEGSHLGVFFLRYFDAKAWQFDSRNRVAVLLMLTGKGGEITSVLEGSDILICEDECNLFQPKPTARISVQTDQSADVQRQLWTAEGQKELTGNGFDLIGGLYQYILLQHGLQKLSKATR